MGVEEYLIASSLTGVLAQRLLRLLCKACKKPIKTPKGFSAEGTFFEAASCEACRGTGYKGRRPIFEIMKLSEAMHAAILKKADAGTLMKIAKKEGLRTLKDDGLRLAALGVTSMDEVSRVTGLLSED